MAESDGIIGYAGVYANVEDAKADFQFIKEAHRENWIGTYDAALFEKTAEGKVKVLDTDATQRKDGAAVGAIVGGVLALDLPAEHPDGRCSGRRRRRRCGQLDQGLDERRHQEARR